MNQEITHEIMVEIAYALPQQQVIIPVKITEGTTAEAAIAASGILKKFPEIDLTANRIGIFGKLSKLDAVLRHLDRVEIYRPLIADPKEVRRQRAAEGKVMKKGGGDATPEA
jgi:putative ubiquitin-RnfH superfamily antitoxin RatB of RatAB toxin-antitoxin module